MNSYFGVEYNVPSKSCYNAGGGAWNGACQANLGPVRRRRPVRVVMTQSGDGLEDDSTSGPDETDDMKGRAVLRSLLSLKDCLPEIDRS